MRGGQACSHCCGGFVASQAIGSCDDVHRVASVLADAELHLAHQDTVPEDRSSAEQWVAAQVTVVSALDRIGFPCADVAAGSRVGDHRVPD